PTPNNAATPALGTFDTKIKSGALQHGGYGRVHFAIARGGRSVGKERRSRCVDGRLVYFSERSLLEVPEEWYERPSLSSGFHVVDCRGRKGGLLRLGKASLLDLALPLREDALCEFSVASFSAAVNVSPEVGAAGGPIRR